MAVSEIIIMMLVYGGLFLYTARLGSSNNKIIFYGHYVFLIVLYGLISHRSDAALKIQLYALEKRVEELERKLNNK